MGQAATDNKETIVWRIWGASKYSLNGVFVDMPPGWDFIPSGNPALTRRLKAAGPYWIVRQKFGRKEYTVGLCAPADTAQLLKEQLEAEHSSPEYLKKLEAERERRRKKEELYSMEFRAAIVAFLDFHEKWASLAEELAAVISEFTTPVGSGTVARTSRIPIEERAKAAVIAWMRHNTTDYDTRHIQHAAGARREVRRSLAGESMELLKKYRKGLDTGEDCPLRAALKKRDDAE